MIKLLIARTRRLVVALAVVGLVIGGLTSFVILREERFVAHATLAMLPGPQVPAQEALGFWEVLNRGQATRTAALALEDPRWLAVMSETTGVPASKFELTAGAIPDTTLIEVNVQADSAWAAQKALDIVVADGVDYAQQVSGPFMMETISVEYKRAQPLSPALAQQIVLFGLVGLLMGAGAGFLIGRSAQKARVELESETDQPTAPIAVLRSEPSDMKRVSGEPLSNPKRSH